MKAARQGAWSTLRLLPPCSYISISSPSPLFPIPSSLHQPLICTSHTHLGQLPRLESQIPSSLSVDPCTHLQPPYPPLHRQTPPTSDLVGRLWMVDLQ
jgi:hypothetical protein